MQANIGDTNESLSSGRLLRTLAEELKTPLMQIARTAELAQLSNQTTDSARIEVMADASLKLLDSYVMSTQAVIGQQIMELEPVSLSALMYDTAEYLNKYAGLYDCNLVLEVGSRNGLVMANPSGLQAALISLGYSFIHVFADDDKSHKLRLVAGTNKNGVSTGVMVDSPAVASDMLHRARSLYGRARQPLSKLTYNSGAGIFVADSLFDSMATQLRVIRGRQSSGLVATLLPSTQLALL